MAEAKTSKYICLVDITSIETQKKYAPGSEISLTEEKAAILLAKGAVKAK